MPGEVFLPSLFAVTTWKLSSGFSVIQNVRYSTPAVFKPGRSSSKTGRTKRPTTTLREGGKNGRTIQDTVRDLLGATIRTRFEYESRCQCLRVF